MKLFNPVEKLVRHLREAGDAIENAAHLIEAKMADLSNAGDAAKDLCRIIGEERDMLMRRIRGRFTDSEIEAADVMCNRCNDSGIWASADRVGQGHDRFRLTIDHLGAPIRYTADIKQISAHVFAHYNLTTGKAVVLMVNGGYGASLTNGADEIIPFIQRQHVGRRGIKWKDVRWIYRDSMGAWDEIVVSSYEGGNTASIFFAPVGNRTERAALEATAAAGIILDGHDRAHIRIASERCSQG